MTLLINKKIGKLSKPSKILKAAIDNKFMDRIIKG